MCYLYYLLQPAFPAGRGLFVALFCLMLLPLASRGQSLTVSLSATNNAPDKCSARTISASVSGGSGSYAYFWSSSPTSSVNLGNGPSITVSPSVATVYTVAVWDNTASLYAEKSISICPVLTGSFSQFIPNSFMEGEIWKVFNASGGTGPLNAYRYELRFINDWGSQVYAASQTISSGMQGLMGGQINWNGRLNGTGNYVPGGNYFYDLRLINCTSNTLFRGTVTFFRPLLLTLSLYPNPARHYVDVDLLGEEGSVDSPTLPEVLQLALVSLQGEVVLSREVTAFPHRLEVSALPEKEYILLFRYGDRLERHRLLLTR